MDPRDLFYIKPSVYISSYCYSILRLEPWTTCSIGCPYCYARWYRGPHGQPRPQFIVARLFEKLARRLSRARPPPPYFRLATLSEPLQDPEPQLRLSYRLASTALRHETPVIINTKLPSRLLREDWLSLLGEMADRRLVLVQVSLSTLGDSSLILEPGAEPPAARLEAVEQLSSHRIPVAVRLQPLIPGFEEEHIRAAIEASSRGAVLAIGEPIRLSPRDVEQLEKLLGVEWRGWEHYELHRVEGRSGLLHPPLEWRLEMHRALAAAMEALGRPYHACKDGLTLHRLPGDCCGFTTIGGYTALRPTLHEALLYRREHGEWPPGVKKLCGYTETLSNLYVCGEKLDEYPSLIARAYRLHERRLERILRALREQRDPAYRKLVEPEHLYNPR